MKVRYGHLLAEARRTLFHLTLDVRTDQLDCNCVIRSGNYLRPSASNREFESMELTMSACDDVGRTKLS
jgi:hypothetical protein